MKDPKNRLPDIGVARLDIDDAMRPVAANSPVVPQRRSRLGREMSAWAIAGLALIALAILGWRSAISRRTNLPSDCCSFLCPAPAWYSILGCGRCCTRWEADGVQDRSSSTGSDPQLWVREFDSLESRPLPDAGGATSPFWSPDSQSIAYFQQGKLKTQRLVGGGTFVVADVSGLVVNVGGSWGPDNTLLFAAAVIYHVPTSGGVPTQVTTLDAARGDVRHISPTYLPDGRHFVFLVVNRDPARSGVYLGSLDSKETGLVEPEAFAASYAPGYLLVGRNSSLVARAFDVATGKTSGEPIVVDANVFSGDGANRLFIGAAAGA